MNNYEALFIVRPDLSEEDRKTLFSQINDAVTKNNGKVIESGAWGERRKLYFRIKKFQEGAYYLMNFTLPPLAVKELNQAYRLNENILRVLITKQE